MGGLSRWSWPDIEGLDKYKGVLYHSAQWDVMEGQSWQDTVKDWGEKTVGVIGVVSLLVLLIKFMTNDRYCRVRLVFKSSQLFSPG